MSDSPEIHLNNPDALSTLLSRLQLSANIIVNGDFNGDWAVDLSGSRRIPFHLLGRGSGWIHLDGQDKQRLGSGDLVLFPYDHQHVISNCEYIPDNVKINTDMTAGEGPSTQMISGFFEFKNKSAWPLLDSLPKVVKVAASEQGATAPYRVIIGLIINELKRGQPGHYTVINQLAYLLFIEVVREQINQGLLKPGLLTAIFDPQLGLSLAAIHNQPEKVGH